MKSRVAWLLLIVALGDHLVAAQTTNTTRLTPADETRFRETALQYLTERYPNIQPSRFLYDGISVLRTQPQLGIQPDLVVRIIVTFVDKNSRTVQSAGNTSTGLNDSLAGMAYLIRWTVNLDPDGRLNAIERREHCDNNILKISPAPIDMLRFPNLAPQTFTNSAPKTDGIIIIQPLRDQPLAPLTFTNSAPNTDGIIIIRPESVPQSP